MKLLPKHQLSKHLSADRGMLWVSMVNHIYIFHWQPLLYHVWFLYNNTNETLLFSWRMMHWSYHKKASSVFGFLMPCLVLLKRPYLKHCGGLPKALWMTNKKCVTNKKMNNNKNYEDLREPLQFSTKAAVNAAHILVSFTSATIPINNANTSINIKNKHMAPYNCAAITCEISVALITMLS